MSKIEIITDPTIEQVDIDAEKSDLTAVIHAGNESEVREFLDIQKDAHLKPMYCHYYTKDKTYTIGIKVIK